MEELDIKQIWKSGGEVDSFNYSAQTIDRIINQGPQNIISRFVKTLRIELWLNLIAFTSFSLVFFIRGSWTWGALFMIINALFYFYYLDLIKKLDREYIDSNVVIYLHEVNKIICRFILHYRIAVVGLGLPGYFMGIYLSGVKTFRWDNPSMMWEDLNIYHYLGILLTLGIAYLLIHLLYGKKATKIKEMIQSLSEEE